MQSSTLYQQLEHSLQPLIAQGHCDFTVALSGGVDSVVLLHALKAYTAAQPQLRISAIYVNHGLSPNAQQWQQFCATLCGQLNIPFQFASVVITPQTRTSLEAQARDARYQALDKLAGKNSVILLGQHLNDQLETFLLRLKRGSGLKGLAAMQQMRTLASGRLCFRPLLHVTRSEIESFAAQYNICHITDDSNSDEQFDRNFLRANVVPLLTERFKGFEHCAARSIGLLQQQQQLLDEYTAADLAQCLNTEKAINISSMREFSEIRIANLIRAWLSLFDCQMPAQKQLAQLIEQAFNAQADAQMLIQIGQGQIRRHQGYLYFVTAFKPLNDKYMTTARLTLADGRTLVQHQGCGVRAPLASEQVSVRFNCNAARIKPLKKPGSNTLKHWFKDAKVAPWLRARIPLIFYNEELVQVVGYFISEQHKAENGVYWQCNK